MAYVSVIQSGMLLPIAQVARQAPIALITDAVIRAARELCVRSRWLTTPITGTLTINTSTYNLGSDTYSEVCGIRAVSVVESADKTTPLTSHNPTEWDTQEAADVPAEYAYIPKAQIVVHPVPNLAYSLNVELVVMPKRGANQLDDRLLQKWEETLINGALSTLLMLPGQKWTDKSEGSVRRGAFESGISRAKSDVFAGYNAGALATADNRGPRTAAGRTRIQKL